MFAAAISKIGYIKWELLVEIWGKNHTIAQGLQNNPYHFQRTPKKKVAQLIFTNQLIIFNSEHILNNIRQLVCRRWVFSQKYNKLWSHHFWLLLLDNFKDLIFAVSFLCLVIPMSPLGHILSSFRSSESSTSWKQIIELIRDCLLL